MAFGSMALFDNHFNIAHFLKNIAYGSIFIGILIDLSQTKSLAVDKNETISNRSDAHPAKKLTKRL